jgi:hypothetical protein
MAMIVGVTPADLVAAGMTVPRTTEHHDTDPHRDGPASTALGQLLAMLLQLDRR